MLGHLPGEWSRGKTWPIGSPKESMASKLTSSGPSAAWTLPRLLTAFNLLTPAADEPAWRQVPGISLKPAAVLIPVIVRDSQLSVLFTRRSVQLRHHPGQISFPGRRQDPEDRDLATTALRETHEELGIDPSMVQLLGQLPAHATHSQFLITPYLGVLRQMPALQPAAGEVAEAFTLPLAPLLQTAAYGRWLLKRQGQTQEVFGVQLQGRFIWGATAHMLWQLAIHLSN